MRQQCPDQEREMREREESTDREMREREREGKDRERERERERERCESLRNTLRSILSDFAFPATSKQHGGEGKRSLAGWLAAVSVDQLFKKQR